MGAVTFSLDKKLIETVKKALPLSIFVETGTYKGDTTAECLDYFEQLYTIELSEELYYESKQRFANEQKVNIYHDDSVNRLAQLKSFLRNKSVLYWLDAHWCVAADTAGEKSQCPLLNEINAIGNLNQESLIVIDDARLFLCSPTAPHEVSQWPQFHEIINALFAISSNHRITIVNDCIIYYPEKIAPQINQYAQSVGVDWLRIMNIYTDKEKLHELLAEKEYQINLLNSALQKLNESAIEKENEIHQLNDTLKNRAGALIEKEREIVNISHVAKDLELSLQDKEHSINQKEQEIVNISRAAKDLALSLQDKEHAINQKEQEIVNISRAAKDLAISLQEKEQAINQKEQEILKISNASRELEDYLQNKEQSIIQKEQSLEEKKQEIQRLNSMINTLNQGLEEKELFIQWQDKFIKQKDFFRFYVLKAFLIIAAYFIFKYKGSFLCKLFNLIAITIKSFLKKISLLTNNYFSFQKNKFKKKFGPFLGVLNQYPPKELVLPKSYYKKPTLNNQLKISIVTPSYQQASYIERTLKSVIDQHYPNLEYFVQDGGSKDETPAILQSYTQWLAGWESKPDKGQSNAINLGFAKTTGHIMAWLNSDDLLLPGTLAYVANYFDKHQDVDVIYGDRIIIDENDMEIGRWVMPKNDYAVLSWADYIPQETLFWRRSIWDKVGGKIDESFQFAMDWDLLIRFRDAGACINRLPRFLGAFRVHTQQKTSAAINEIGAKEMQIIRTRCNGFEPLAQDINKNINAYMLGHFFEHNVRLIHYKR